MADYVLVHGAWGGGFGYDRVASELRAAGHRVLVAELTGLGTRKAELSPAIDLATHIADVVTQVDASDFTDIVLVGHSYGGMVVTGVIGKIGGRIAHIVYLDAFLPEDGQSLWDIVGDWEHRHYIDGQRLTPGLVAPLPGLDRDLRLGKHPLLTLIEPVTFTGREAEVRHHSYIFASGWQPTPFARFHARVKDDPRWQAHEIACGHFVMGDAPGELLAILLAAGND
jgi:pimeloyl-ACP methyl ester carboxylesterase